MKSEKRWIEIQFAYMCFDLYNSFRDYILTTNYIEFLAELSDVDKNSALRLLQKVNQLNNIRPTNSEFVCIARQNKVTIARILEILKISKSTYIEYTHKENLDIEHPPNCSDSEIAIMKKLLDTHLKIKRTGI